MDIMTLDLITVSIHLGKLSTVLGSLDLSFFIATGISLCGAMVSTLLKIFEVRILKQLGNEETETIEETTSIDKCPD